MSHRPVTALAIFDADLAGRGLDLPAALVMELRQLLITPRVSQVALWQRLARGCAVLDARGGADAPDALWDRWEAILAAWWATQQEIEAGLATARKRRITAREQRPIAHGPTFNWHLDTDTNNGKGTGS